MVVLLVHTREGGGGGGGGGGGCNLGAGLIVISRQKYHRYYTFTHSNK